jgi:bifunctional non-homologous end joining protein LigD
MRPAQRAAACTSTKYPGVSPDPACARGGRVQAPDGISDFEALLTRRGRESASFVAFDLLSLDGEDRRLRPLEERRAALSRLVGGLDAIVFSEAIEGEGATVFEKACALGLEGIVSKRSGSLYLSGRRRSWLKTKNPKFART